MNDYDFEYIGVDETGVGDYFTPVISVACFIKRENIDKIKNLGIKDSKKLSDSKIIQIIETIKKYNLASFKDTILEQKNYNHLIELGINNNAIKTLIHFNSIKRLKKEIKKEIPIIIDQYSNKKNIEKHLERLQEKNIIKNLDLNNFSLILETKADENYIGVSCASIMARYLLIKKMQEQKKEYDFDFNLGTSQQSIDLGVSFIKKYGKDKLYKVAKISFKTTNKIFEKLNSDPKK